VDQVSYDLKELQRLEKAIGPLPYGTERSVANRALADALLVAAPELLERMAKLEALYVALHGEWHHGDLFLGEATRLPMANEPTAEDTRRAAEWYRDAGYNDTAHDLATLAAQFAAVRAPLEARIAELEIALIEDASEWRNEAAKAREKALQEAADVCWNGIGVTLDVQTDVLRRARDAILGLIELGARRRGHVPTSDVTPAAGSRP